MMNISKITHERQDNEPSISKPLLPLYMLVSIWTLLIGGFAAWDNYQSNQFEMKTVLKD